MPKETITPRERWLAVLKGQKPDRVPMDYWATEEAISLLLAIIFKQLALQKILSLCMKQDTNTDGINSKGKLCGIIKKSK